MNSSPVAVITSRKAKKHLEEIKGKHADLIRGIQEQKIRVDALAQQKKAEDQARDQQSKTDSEAKRQADVTAKQKEQELADKRAAAVREAQEKAQEMKMKERELEIMHEAAKS